MLSELIESGECGENAVWSQRVGDRRLAGPGTRDGASASRQVQYRYLQRCGSGSVRSVCFGAIEIRH
jgi:hypothetical protein